MQLFWNDGDGVMYGSERRVPVYELVKRTKAFFAGLKQSAIFAIRI